MVSPTGRHDERLRVAKHSLWLLHLMHFIPTYRSMLFRVATKPLEVTVRVKQSGHGLSSTPTPPEI